jgi:hypothetical protein
MAETLNNPKVPDSINVRMSDADKAIAAELMAALGIFEGSHLMRYCLRAAHREALSMRGSAMPGASAHRAIDPRG